MFKADDGRNLLFGLLALQNNFIGRDALVAAFAVWVAHRERPLGRILVERGELESSRFALVEALVGEHLRAHGGDVERSLATVRPAGRLGAELARLADAELKESLDSFGPAEAGGGDPDATRFVPPDSSTSSARYRILRPHARGGLGEVFVAQDEEVNREVALKQIQDRHADDTASRARFLNEAEITGGLEHPGIVPVYGLGQYADGRPYYAMRFVKGDSLKEAVARFHDPGRPAADEGARAVEFRKLLGRFVDVCDAIAFAHSRCVLHRDLKPGNIMLGKYGETLVVDWGLAKAAGATEDSAPSEEPPLRPRSSGSGDATKHGQLIGTPGFMSPEQARGEVKRLGPGSDIYSLGATLYQVLTGRPPFDDPDVSETLRRVRLGEFPTPRSVRLSLPRPLEAICLKAMALRPEERYGSARALADDVERWLADEPVSAWREPLSVRFGRWTKRHRTALAATSAVLAAAVVLLAFTGFLLRREQRKTEAARRLAAANFARARGAVDDYLELVSDSPRLRANPTLKPLREQLLRRALGYYQDFLAQRGDDPGLRREAAGAFVKLAAITFEIGSKVAAIEAQEKALSLYRELLKESPADPALRLELGTGLRRLGNMRRDIGRTAEARAALGDARSTLTPLAVDGGPPEARPELAVVATDLGRLDLDAGRLDAAGPALEQALALWRSIRAARPDDARARRELARCLNDLGNWQFRTGKPDRAARSLAEALGLLEPLVRDDPLDVELIGDLAVNRMNSGVLALEQGRKAEGLGSLGAARGSLEKLVADNPDDVRFTSALAYTLDSLGQAALGERRFEEAERLGRQAMELQRRLIKVDPDTTLHRRGLVKSANTVANAVLYSNPTDAGRAERALGLYRDALALAKALVAEEPDDPENGNLTGMSCFNIGLAHLIPGRDREALAAFEEGLSFQRPTFKEAPDARTVRHTLAALLSRTAEVQRNLGRVAESSNTVLEYESLWIGTDHGRELYYAAIWQALCVPIAGGAADADRYASRAVAALEKAVAHGFHDRRQLLAEPPFAPLKGRPDFLRLLDDLRD